VIPLGFAIRRVFSALANNEAVAMVGDVDFLNIEEGIRVDFFGRPAFMPKGPAAISLKSGAPIVVGATFRSAPGKFKLILKPAIDPRPWQERPDAVYALTKRVLADLEALIMQCPAQWFMVNDIWGFLK
jgi:KDO2-lipid IV(A) lauroyltransferase